MLKKLLYIFGVLSLVCAGVVFYLCASQWSQCFQISEIDIEPTIIEIFKSSGLHANKINQETVSPLVKQSMDFALLINPPKPTESNDEPKEVVKPKDIRPPRITPKFKLLATSCNRDKPEDSIALISEPGRGDHWAKAGDIIGNFILERIEPGSIIYRYGSQSSEMTVETRPPVRIAKEQPIEFVNEANP